MTKPPSPIKLDPETHLVLTDAERVQVLHARRRWQARSEVGPLADLLLVTLEVAQPRFDDPTLLADLKPIVTRIMSFSKGTNS